MFPYYLSELNRSETLSALSSYDCSVSIDALRSDRPYRKTMSEEQTRCILAFGYESHFDPTVYKAFIELLNESALDLYSGTAVEEPFEIQRVILEHTV